MNTVSNAIVTELQAHANVRRVPRRRTILLLAACLLSMAVGTFSVASPASASSTKCSFYGTGISGLVRNGQFCSTVNGSRSWVSSVSGNFGTTIPSLDKVCNPSIKIDVYDRFGRWTTWRQGSQKIGCSWGTWNSVNTLNANLNAPCNGYILVSLQSYGSTVSTNRHDIFC